jgi:hypothetical protein
VIACSEQDDGAPSRLLDECGDGNKRQRCMFLLLSLLLINMLDLGMLPHSATFTDMAFVLGVGCIICDCIIFTKWLQLSTARVFVFSSSLVTIDQTLEKTSETDTQKTKTDTGG